MQQIDLLRSLCLWQQLVYVDGLPAGVYDEKVLVGLDYAINEASKRGIRVVPVFANYWAMYGGIDQYNTWSFEAGSGKSPAYTSSVLLPETGEVCYSKDLLSALAQNDVSVSDKLEEGSNRCEAAAQVLNERSGHRASTS